MMVTVQEMTTLEESAFARGVSAEELMEEAGRGIAAATQQFFPAPGRLIAYVGRGHNGGDALVAGRYLVERGWELEVRCPYAREDLRPLTQKQWERVEGLLTKSPPGRGRDVVIFDGLLGIGARGPLRSEVAQATRQINVLRQSEGVWTIALDLPSGVDGDSGEVQCDAVEADMTVSVAHAKVGLLADTATGHVGRLVVVPLGELASGEENAPAAWVLSSALLRPWMGRRDYELHKVSAGRVGVVAGSMGMTGAAVLVAHAALRAGAGLVTLYAPRDVYPILAAMSPPEVMVVPWNDPNDFSLAQPDVWAVGPGLGALADLLVAWMVSEERPMVIDADGLNALARAGAEASLDAMAGPRLLTPHPGEMRRLQPELEGLSRREQARAMTERFSPTLLLKGSRSLVAEFSQPLAYNSSGHPGMATGGMGDATTGFCAGLMAQNFSPYRAACLGAWLSGRSAEIASQEQAQRSLVAGDVIAHWPAAWRDCQRLCY